MEGATARRSKRLITRLKCELMDPLTLSSPSNFRSRLTRKRKVCRTLDRKYSQLTRKIFDQKKRTIMVKKGGNPRLHHIQKTPASLSTLGMKPIANASWLHLSICNEIYKFANCMQTATSCATKWCVLQVGCLMQKWLHYGLTEVNICSSTNTVRHTKYQHCTSSANAAWICRIAVTAHLSEKWTNSRSDFDHKRRSNSVQAIMAIPWRLKWKMHFEKKHSGSYEANSWKWRMSISNMKQTWLKTEQTNKQTKVNSSISKITEQELNGSKALISSHNSSEVVIRHSHFSLSRSNSH